MKINYSNLTLSAGKPTHMFQKEDGRTWECNKWTVVVSSTDSDRRARFTYYTGIAHKGLVDEGQMKDALLCFVTDARCGQLSFRDFCGELGYDQDSRKAYKTWEACKRATKKFETLGVDFNSIAEQLEEEGV